MGNNIAMMQNRAPEVFHHEKKRIAQTHMNEIYHNPIRRAMAPVRCVLCAVCGGSVKCAIIRGMETKRKIPSGVINWAEIVRECFFVDNAAAERGFNLDGK